MNEAINLDEIKRHIQCCIDTEECLFCSFFRVGCDKRTFAKLMMEAVRQLEAQVAEDINVPSWISVKERLPEDNDDVLVCIESRSVDIGYCAFRRDGSRLWHTYTANHAVTHWMPLPELPKEG